MKFNDYITHIDNEEDLPFLRSVLFDVNMRLFKSSLPYRNLILKACNYIRGLCRTEMEGYKKPHGMSGANAGIPFNIIAYLKDRNIPNKEKCIVMINPIILSYSNKKINSFSNCGSIRLKEPIEIERSKKVYLSWYNERGEEIEGNFDRNSGSLTIQHEVDHNNGILITDRVIKSKSNYNLKQIQTDLS